MVREDRFTGTRPGLVEYALDGNCQSFPDQALKYRSSAHRQLYYAAGGMV